VAFFAAASLFADVAIPEEPSLAQSIHSRLDGAASNDVLRPDLSAFYAARAYAPAWQEPERLAALIDALQSLAADGLEPKDYDVAQLVADQSNGAGADGPTDQRAELDLRASQAYLLALRHLHWGRVDPHRIDPNYNFESAPSDATAWLRSIGAFDLPEAGAIARVFSSARAQHPAYTRLTDALQRLRKIDGEGGWPAISDGAKLKPGEFDVRIPLLRRRLQLGGYLENGDAADSTFDPSLEMALRDFQSEQYLDADGKLGTHTRTALNVPIHARIDQVRVNLERARWLLREAEGDFVLVDIAGYKVTYFRSGKPVFSARAQVGMPYRSTPSFRSRISAITFNPTWTVPSTIFYTDLLPKIRTNPAILAANHIRVFDATGEEQAATAVDWSAPRGIVLRQDAGPENSLGRVAIHFANPFGVYMHDTPHKELFAPEQRAFSSGCIRIERPLELAVRLLEDNPGWSREQVDNIVTSGETKVVGLKDPVTVLLMYWSVDTHDGVRIAFKPDVYGKDAAVLRELGRPIERRN